MISPRPPGFRPHAQAREAERSALAAIAHAGRGRRRSAKLSREAAWGCGGQGSPRFSFFDGILNATQCKSILHEKL